MDTTLLLNNDSQVETRFEITIDHEPSEACGTIPNDIDFTFGKFDYELHNLPIGLNNILQETSASTGYSLF